MSEYQNRGVDHIIDHTGCALFLDMGMGKTVIVLTALQRLFESFAFKKVLIIAPKRVALHTWPDEIRLWDHITMRFTNLSGTPAVRAAKTYDSAPIHIINRELVPWLVQARRTDWPYDVVVIDESSSFKSPSAKRFKELRKVLPHVERRILMTGTPAANSYLDLWSQLFLIDGGERLLKAFSKYRSKYFESDYMEYNWWLRPGAKKVIQDKIKDVCMRLAAKDYLSLPDRINVEVRVHLPPAAKKIYTTMEEQFILETSEEKIPILFAAALVNKMLQCANGAVYTDADKTTEIIHDEKLDALESIVEECAGSPVLVAYTYQSDLERIRKRFPKVVDIREKGAVEKWCRGEIPLLAAHPAASGHGLNLQAGGNHMVWFGLPWSLELYDQMNARLHRQGQDKPVYIYHIVADGTADETVLASLGDKHLNQAELLDAMKADIRGRR